MYNSFICRPYHLFSGSHICPAPVILSTPRSLFSLPCRFSVYIPQRIGTRMYLLGGCHTAAN